MLKTLVEIITAGGLAGADLVKLLEWARDHATDPSLKGLAIATLAKLQTVLSPTELQNLGRVVIDELAAFPTQGLKPKPHRSDTAV